MKDQLHNEQHAVLGMIDAMRDELGLLFQSLDARIEVAASAAPEVEPEPTSRSQIYTVFDELLACERAQHRELVHLTGLIRALRSGIDGPTKPGDDARPIGSTPVLARDMREAKW